MYLHGFFMLNIKKQISDINMQKSCKTLQIALTFIPFSRLDMNKLQSKETDELASLKYKQLRESNIVHNTL